MSQDAQAPEPNVEPKPRKTGWREVVRALSNPKVLLTLALGFGSGLPFLLTGATFGLWLREHDVSLAAIGFLSWVGLAYSFKFLWAPIIDKIDAPFLGFLGRRRSWMALSQIAVGGALIWMAIVGPEGGLTVLGVAALVVAFASATQDIVVDAWRIESADDTEDLALITSAFQLGYRFAILAANALILFVANGIGWAGAYALYGAGMSIALIATLIAREPISRAAQSSPAIWTPRGIYDAIVGPFVAFLKTHGGMAVLMLAAISLYRLPDFVMGPMVGPFYVDVGIPREVIGSVRLTFGLVGTLLGISAAGLCALRFGFGKTLLLGAILGPGSNIAYTLLAWNGYSPALFSGVLFTENFSEGFAGAALVAYMSSLTSIGYTATQYALLSSFYALLGKVLKGFSGQAVEALQASTGGNVMQGYALFFLGTALVGIPALVLCLILNRQTKKQIAAAEPPPAPA
jgi:PAT family beta-lactamase induction signal transducer AmpG